MPAKLGSISLSAAARLYTVCFYVSTILVSFYNEDTMSNCNTLNLEL